MNKYKFLGILLAAIVTIPAMAFSTDDERIDSYLNLLSSEGMEQEKEEMLERLQWSGLSDPRLFDPMESFLLENSTLKSTDLHGDKRSLMAYMLRALGYSGNEKYSSTLNLFKKDAVSGSLRRYAKKAQEDLRKFRSWNRLISSRKINVEGKSAEVASYMKMLDVDDVFVQRLAARAIFHEGQRDADLIALTAEKLEAVYMDENLDREAQDTAAWFCKAIGQSGNSKYANLLKIVAEKSPHGKIQKYAIKYAIK